MGRLRRSGRIAKEIPIVLLGTDTAGKPFSEETKTVVLSRHGAGIVSRYEFAPDELLTLRCGLRQASIRRTVFLNQPLGFCAWRFPQVPQDNY